VTTKMMQVNLNEQVAIKMAGQTRPGRSRLVKPSQTFQWRRSRGEVAWNARGMTVSKNDQVTRCFSFAGSDGNRKLRKNHAQGPRPAGRLCSWKKRRGTARAGARAAADEASAAAPGAGALPGQVLGQVIAKKSPPASLDTVAGKHHFQGALKKNHECTA
jgi:hypothetical protein